MISSPSSAAHHHVQTQERLHEQLARNLAQEIVSGRIEPGQPIGSESSLATQFQVSKIVAREACQLLAALGLVQIQHGKRTIVRPQSDWNVLNPLVHAAHEAEGLGETFVPELYELRLLLEPRAAELAAVRSDPAHLERLNAILREMEGVSQVHHERFLELDHEFHLEMLKPLTSNRVLSAVLRDVNVLLSRHWALLDLSRDHGTVIEQHRRILDGIGAADPNAAAEATREHLRWAAQRFRDVHSQHEATREVRAQTAQDNRAAS